MREMIKMVVVLTILSSFSGGLLASIRNETKERIEYQKLKFVKGPAIKEILKGSENDPIVDRFKIADGKIERSFFIGVFNGEPNTVAFECYGKGFGGDMGVMVGVNIKNDNLIGIGVTTHSETPGVGSKAKTDPSFGDQFLKHSIVKPVKVKTDGGDIDIISGATITSRGVCMAVTNAGSVYNRLKSNILKQLQNYKK